MIKYYAPWSQAAINCLQWRQNDYRTHPYTCGNNSQHRNLVPTRYGWICPDCNYKQNWFLIEDMGFFGAYQRITPLFAWYDMWIGLFWDRERRMLFVFPLPCLGFTIRFRERKSLEERK